MSLHSVNTRANIYSEDSWTAFITSAISLVLRKSWRRSRCNSRRVVSYPPRPSYLEVYIIVTRSSLLDIEFSVGHMDGGKNRKPGKQIRQIILPCRGYSAINLHATKIIRIMNPSHLSRQQRRVKKYCKKSLISKLPPQKRSATRSTQYTTGKNVLPPVCDRLASPPPMSSTCTSSSKSGCLVVVVVFTLTIVAVSPPSSTPHCPY